MPWLPGLNGVFLRELSSGRVRHALRVHTTPGGGDCMRRRNMHNICKQKGEEAVLGTDTPTLLGGSFFCSEVSECYIT